MHRNIKLKTWRDRTTWKSSSRWKGIITMYPENNWQGFGIDSTGSG